MQNAFDIGLIFGKHKAGSGRFYYHVPAFIFGSSAKNYVQNILKFLFFRIIRRFLSVSPDYLCSTHAAPCLPEEYFEP